MSRITLLLFIVFFTAGVGIFYSCNQSKEKAKDTAGETSPHASFVGDEACQSCHLDEFKGWKGSHHDYAMNEANETTVRGNFKDVTFTHNQKTYRFFRRDSLYMVEAPGSNDESVRYQISHTFGWEPLQQYLIDFDKGKLQALNIAWDTEKKEWFALNPDQDISHGDWLHWSGGAMNWNTMCADCHSTNLRQNYIAEADSFHTNWSSMNVSCEACHGPAKDHVTFMKSDEAADATIERIREDLQLTSKSGQMDQINQCAQCHALREEVTGTYKHKGDFLDHYSVTLPHPEAYFPDGQIKDEVYVYGSFLQSKMFGKGIECSDCHDPHSLELKANVTDNTLCMQCHESQYDTYEHLRHSIGTEGSRCIDCHMMGRYYMEVDFRRDHSFRVPRPDLSAEFDTPNACNNCHTEQSPEWAANAIEQWYGPDRPNHFSEVLLKANEEGREVATDLEALIADTSQPDIARATAIWYLGEWGAGRHVGLLTEMLNDENPLVRTSATRVLGNLPEEVKINPLQEALDDSVRSVRVAAAGGLTEFSISDISFPLKDHFKNALQEYRQYLQVTQYFPQGLMNKGQFFEKRGKPEQAIMAYRDALKKDSLFNPARINLAYLYNQQGNNDEAEQLLKTVIEIDSEYGPAYYSLGLLVAEEQRLEKASSYFEEAARLMPGHARLHYNWAISLQQLERPEQAEQKYLEAIEIDPDHPDYRYGLCTLYIQQEQFQKALSHAQKLADLQPQSQRSTELLNYLKQQINE
ncbi:tetratricopeptide repeat protein [Aliifodinibius salicampi]|uniref:Tetratricopeptide repeat protein n=1 Tax=Fodinibius salicampi TaxID=1920655 RepID=A0ABT3PVN7_9BACT|nr:tetratricopeptide repeat protein [Fodinibius salicampi]MCW9711919.1 tetratricopeptide repeat protein [Fodinibius salicampi]